MKPHHIFTQFAESDGVRASLEAVVTSPKVTTGAIIGNVSVLTAINADVITGYLALFSAVASALTVGVMTAYWMIKTAREWKAMQRDDK